MLEIINETFIPNWIEIKLGDIIKFKSGKPRPDDFCYIQDAKRTIPVYGGNGISGYTNKAFSDKRHLVIGRVGEYCGCVHIADAPNWVTDNALYSDIWLKRDVDLDFLAKYLSYLNLNRLKRKAGQPLITQTVLHNLKLYLPPLAEQRAIARALRAVQVAREARLHELALERERKAALMEHLFTHGTRGESTKQTEIGEMPESWNIIQLEDVCRKIVDCPHSTPQFSNSGVIVTRNFNIRNGLLVLQPTFYTTEEEYTERIKRCEPIEGDILFSREAPVGEACLVPPKTKLCLGQRMMLLRVDQAKMINFFLVQIFYYSTVRSLMLSISSGVTAKHLNVAEVKRLKIPVPSIDEQKQIADTLSACDSKIAALDYEARLHDELFRAMLEELMSGRLRADRLVEPEG